MKASAEPLQVILSGGIGLQSAKSYLIGQHVGASLETGGLQATDYSWGVGGGRAFKSYTANDSNAVLTPLSNETAPTCGFYFAKPDPDVATVACSFTLQVPAGASPALGLDVTLSRDCVVEAPHYSLNADIGSPQGDPPDDPRSIHLWGALRPGETTSIDGIGWRGTVTTPSQYGAGGGWNYTQLIWPGRVRKQYDFNTRLVELEFWEFNGRKCLDGTFAYAQEYPTLYNADGSLQLEGDAPSQPVLFPTMAVTVNENFVTYILYQPPGADSCLVPLKDLSWFWGFSSAPDSSQIFQVNNPSSGWSLLEDFPAHPEWDTALDAPSARWIRPAMIVSYLDRRSLCKKK